MKGFTMKVTKELTRVITPMNFEQAIAEDELKAVFARHEMPGYSAELDIPERTEDHVRMESLVGLLAYAKQAGVGAVLFDVTYFPPADDGEVARQVKQLADELGIAPKVIQNLCEAEIAEYLALDAQRDTSKPVHTIVEAHVNGTAIAWYGINEYPRLKKIVLAKLASGGDQAKRAFARRAAEMQVELNW